MTGGDASSATREQVSDPTLGAGSRSERLWPAALAVAAAFAFLAAPRVLAGYAGAAAAVTVLAVNAVGAARRLAPSLISTVGFGAAVCGLVVTSFGGVPGPGVFALAVATLGGVSSFARSSLGAIACVLLIVAAASGGFAARGDADAALAIAGLLGIAAVVVVPAHMHVLDLEDTLRWARQREGSRGTASATAEEATRRAESEVMAARQALARSNELRRQAEARALDAVRTKEAFLARMSHELRTPLNQILGYSEILLEESEGADAGQLRGDAERIQVAGRNLLEVLENMLDLSNIEAGKQSLDLAPLPLYEFLQELVDSVAATARRRGDTLRLRCSPDIGALVTDRVKLRRILGALLGNACKFTENGTVRLAVRREAETMCFEVSDTGVGIAAEALQSVFEPFFQADESSTRRHDGAGLGLTICKHLTAMLGGEITATSELGKGSTFTVKLPLEFKSPRAAGLVLMSMTSSSPR